MTNNCTKKESNQPNLLKNKNNIPKKEEAMLLPGKKKAPGPRKLKETKRIIIIKIKKRQQLRQKKRGEMVLKIKRKRKE